MAERPLFQTIRGKGGRLSHLFSGPGREDLLFLYPSVQRETRKEVSRDQSSKVPPFGGGRKGIWGRHHRQETLTSGASGKKKKNSLLVRRLPYAPSIGLKKKEGRTAPHCSASPSSRNCGVWKRKRGDAASIWKPKKGGEQGAGLFRGPSDERGERRNRGELSPVFFSGVTPKSPFLCFPPPLSPFCPEKGSFCLSLSSSFFPLRKEKKGRGRQGFCPAWFAVRKASRSPYGEGEEKKGK